MLRLLVILTLMINAPAWAQGDVFLNKNKNAEGTNLYTPNTNKKDGENRQLMQPAPEAPQSIKAFANQYFENCQKQQHPVLNGENLEMLCACSSAKVTQVMTTDNVKDMQQDTSEGQYQRNRLLTDVYIPCMEFPTQALLLDTCLKNPNVGQKMRNGAQICKCMAGGVSAYMVKEAPKYVRQALQSNPGDLDPLSTFLNSAEYQQQSQATLLACLQTHELGAQ